jgi:hypothetical protein
MRLSALGQQQPLKSLAGERLVSAKSSRWQLDLLDIAVKLVSTWRRVKSIGEIFHTLQTISLPIEVSVQPLNVTLEDHVKNVANIRGIAFDFDTDAF